jgi:hypothetical protein
MKRKYDKKAKKDLAYSSWYMRFTPELADSCMLIYGYWHTGVNKVIFIYSCIIYTLDFIPFHLGPVTTLLS